MRFHSAACAAVLAAGAATASAFTFAPPLAAAPSTIARGDVVGAARSSFGAPAPRPVAFGLPTASTAPSTTALSLAAGGGAEALTDYVATLANAESKLASKLRNPKLVKLAGVAAVPLSYVVGAAMTPSRRLAARAVGGVIAAATAGGIGKSAVEVRGASVSFFSLVNVCPASLLERRDHPEEVCSHNWRNGSMVAVDTLFG